MGRSGGLDFAAALAAVVVLVAAAGAPAQAAGNSLVKPELLSGSTPEPFCGDGVINQPEEFCDGTAFPTPPPFPVECTGDCRGICRSDMCMIMPHGFRIPCCDPTDYCIPRGMVAQGPCIPSRCDDPGDTCASGMRCEAGLCCVLAGQVGCDLSGFGQPQSFPCCAGATCSSVPGGLCCLEGGSPCLVDRECCSGTCDGARNICSGEAATPTPSPSPVPTATPTPYCGDGILNQPAEVCDGEAFPTQVPEYAIPLLQCTDDCRSACGRVCVSVVGAALITCCPGTYCVGGGFGMVRQGGCFPIRCDHPGGSCGGPTQCVEGVCCIPAGSICADPNNPFEGQHPCCEGARCGAVGEAYRCCRAEGACAGNAECCSGSCDGETRNCHTPVPSPTWPQTATSTPRPTTTPRPPEPTRTGRPPCVGDCDDRGDVTVDELLRGVGLALQQDVPECSAFDADRSGAVTVDELVEAVHNALFGCARR